MRIRDVVTLPKFNETAKRPQARDRSLHGFAGEAIENHVNANAGDLPDIVDKGRRTRVDHMTDSKGP